MSEERASGSDEPTVIALRSGHAVEVVERGSEGRLSIRGAGGEILLAITITKEGPLLSLSGASIEIKAEKRLALSCETLAIEATQDASIAVGGALHETVRGSVAREAGRSSRLSAREVKIEASPGGVVVEANDDVDIKGERVRLNSDDPPMPLTPEEHRARVAAREAARSLPDDIASPLVPKLPSVGS